MALAGLVVFTACEDDRDSNPVLNTSGNVTFQLNAPEVGASTVDLARSEGVALTWSQPVLTEDNAPLGLAGVYGFQYAAQLSKDGKFDTSFDEALSKVEKDEDGNYLGQPTGYNYTTLPSGYTSCASTISGTEINRGLNELYLYEENNMPETEHVYIRIVAQLVKTNGEVLQLATSNTQELNLIPSEWVDVMAVPVEVGYLWVPGNGNGWNHGVCPILVAEDGKTFKGYAYMNGEFKFTLADNWDAEYNNGSFTSTTENVDLGDGAGGNLNYTGEASMCWIEVTPSTGELLITPVKWSIIGGFNSWGDDAFLTYDEAKHCLSLTYDFDSDTEFKFRRDCDWGINFGGASYDALEQDGPNFTVTAGTHTFKLFLERPSVDGIYAEVQ